MIEARQLSKRFDKLLAVNALDLKVEAGQVYAFLGPNGAGKTTTIRLITGILQPDAGELRILGKSYRRHRMHILNRIGYIPDRPFLYGRLTAMETLAFLGSVRKMKPDLVRHRARQLLERFDLTHVTHELVERFSHGMRQKLIMAGALLHEPDLLVVDEPMVGLDPRAARYVKRLFLQLAQEGKTVFMSTHTLEVAAQLCDRVGIIHQGRMVADESLTSLTERLQARNGDLEAVFLALTGEQDDEVIPQ